jgi:bifunctional UDP-N-acetylglucosamine pyrophosphorylase/glucosamine-1-phosphate N-acetyltransferase
MIDFVIEAIDDVADELVIIVLSPELNANNDLIAHLQQRLGNRLGIAVQHTPNGTGDALRTGFELVQDMDRIVVLFADHPLLEKASVDGLLDSLEQSSETVLALLTCDLESGGSYGRIDRDSTGTITRIVERKDDDPRLRSGMIEVNTGIMAVRSEWLSGAVGRLTESAATGEVYLTQLAELANQDGRRVESYAGGLHDLTGINDRVDLSIAQGLLQTRLREDHQRNGVTFVNGASTTIEFDVEIGADVLVDQGCVLRAGTRIGSGSSIGPNSVLDRAHVGRACRITASFVIDSTIEDGADVGPFSHIRAGTVIEAGVHVGTSSEVKNSRIASGAQIGHFGYIGDAEIGAGTNIGAGVVTCNFDCKAKHRTSIGANAFIGSDTMLVAPVVIGDEAVTGAGSVVTRDVDSGERVAGVPARPLRVSQEGRKGQ